MNLLNKQSFSLFYGSLKNKHIKKITNLVNNISKKNKQKITGNLIEVMERRLSTVLYRSHFTKSIREAKFLIKHGHIIVNNYPVLNNNYITSIGDTINISNKINPVIKYNVLSSNMWPIPPDNLLVNFKTFSICITGNCNISTLSNKFPFHFSIWKLINYYN